MPRAAPFSEDRGGGSRGPPRNPRGQSRRAGTPRSSARSWASSGEAKGPAPSDIDPDRESEDDDEVEGVPRHRPFLRQSEGQDFRGHPSGNEDREGGPEVQDAALFLPPVRRESRNENGQDTGQ